jgi:hypothetical protein
MGFGWDVDGLWREGMKSGSSYGATIAPPVTQAQGPPAELRRKRCSAVLSHVRTDGLSHAQ